MFHVDLQTDTQVTSDLITVRLLFIHRMCTQNKTKKGKKAFSYQCTCFAPFIRRIYNFSQVILKYTIIMSHNKSLSWSQSLGFLVPESESGVLNFLTPESRVSQKNNASAACVKHKSQEEGSIHTDTVVSNSSKTNVK